MFIFCAVQDDLDFELDPVSEPSDQERADLAKCGTDNIVTAYNAGLISQRTAFREMKQQSSRTGTWTNITDEEIMNASDEIEPQGEMGGFPGMDGEEDGAGGPDLPHAGRGGEVGDKPPPEAPGKPPQAPKEAHDSFPFYHTASDEIVWRTSETGKKYMIDTRTGEIVGGSPYISHKQVKKTKDFTPAELNANMEKAVRGLCGVRCKKGLKSPRIIIKRVSDHANFRMLERGVSPELVKSIVMEPALTRLCNDPRKVYYLKGDVYVIVGIDGTICTCVRKSEGIQHGERRDYR